MSFHPHPEKSWSHSRDQFFQECPRKYYYQYYGSHNGWRADAPERAQALYRLKQLLNLYLYLGETLHDAAEMYINRWEQKGVGFLRDELFQRVRNLLNQAYRESLDADAWWQAPKRRKMLAELYYSQEKRLADRAVAEIKSRMGACVDHLIQSESLHEVIRNPEYRLVEVEKLNSFYLQGIKVYVKLDALYRHEAGKYVIIDWKSGLEDDRNEEQMQLYAYYLHNALGAPLEKIEIRTEYLLKGSCHKEEISFQGLEAIEQKILDSAAEMDLMLLDPEANRPRPEEEFRPALDARSCRFCNFRAICTVQHR
ncbi:PD-(D/E)XK nuclease family protein [Tumebacillus lipolyticus]|uniref:PD-(D/E)XK nuclease family protein n=1 Tax=Tumebacillus lipolyticus TaxID=1280370 RepID=A0ABW5A2S9_9BACL